LLHESAILSLAAPQQVFSMATDFLFYWMMQPFGLALIGLSLAIPFLFWWLVLGKTFAGVGFRPLIIGCVSAAIGLLIANFGWAYAEFSARVARGVLQEERRWAIVPGWTVYTSVLSLILVIPLMALGAPYTAFLIRLRKLNFVTIALSVLGLWLAIVLVVWVSPSNEWHRAHRLESLVRLLWESLPGIVLVAVPFLLGIHAASRSAHRKSV
jgi:hypothetical protein